MKTGDDYRTIAENCMRKADAAKDERDKPLWATLAQSWLRLAEDRQRVDDSYVSPASGYGIVGQDERSSHLN